MQGEQPKKTYAKEQTISCVDFFLFMLTKIPFFWLSFVLLREQFISSLKHLFEAFFRLCHSVLNKKMLNEILFIEKNPVICINSS